MHSAPALSDFGLFVCVGLASRGPGCRTAPGWFLSLAAFRCGAVLSVGSGGAVLAWQNKRMAEEEKRHNLVEQVAKLERGMEAEIKRRMEADKALQVTVEAEMKAMQEAHHQQMRDIQMSMNASVDALSRTLADLHRELQARSRGHTLSARSLRASYP